MAITVRASADGSGNSITVPAATVAGDLIVWMYATAASSNTDNRATPAGFTLTASQLNSQTATGFASTVEVYVRVAGASDAGVTFTRPASVNSFGQVSRVVVYAGVAGNDILASGSTVAASATSLTGPLLALPDRAHVLHWAFGRDGTGSLDTARTILANGSGSITFASGEDGPITGTSPGRNFTSTSSMNEPVHIAVAFDANLAPSAPTVLSPNGGETLDFTKTITWTGSTDADSDPIAYNVEFSADNGSTWTRIASGVTGTSLAYDFRTLPETGQGRIRVQATDGLTPSAWDASDGAFTVRHNLPPNAPALSYPAGNVALDRASAQRFSFVFSDPNEVDSQSAHDLRYRLTGAAAWTVRSGGPSQFHDIPAGTFAAGSYEWQVRSYDAEGAVGPYSGSEFFTAQDVPAGPAITDPINGQTISTPTYVVQWTASQQEAYQLQTVADSAGNVNATVVYTDTGTVSSAADRGRTISLPVNGRFEHARLRVRVGGLWSPWASARYSVSYTPPATPAVVATSLTSSIQLAITDPAPTGTQPVVDFHDVYRRAQQGGPLLRIATRVAGSYVDHTPASGVEYAYRIVAVGVNGTSSPTAASYAEVRAATSPDTYLGRRQSFDTYAAATAYLPEV